VAYLDPGHYWGTDASLALMQRGWEAELTPDLQARLPRSQLVEDSVFAFPGVPGGIEMAIAFGVFTHLPAGALLPALQNLHQRLRHLRKLLLTVFLGPAGSCKQPDGVVTHPDRPPYHRPAADVEADAKAAGFDLSWRDRQLPRGQHLAVLQPR
jgi:hypothetical protein